MEDKEKLDKIEEMQLQYLKDKLAKQKEIEELEKQISDFEKSRNNKQESTGNNEAIKKNISDFSQNWIFARVILIILVIVSWSLAGKVQGIGKGFIIINLVFLAYFIYSMIRYNIIIKIISLIGVLYFIVSVLIQDIAEGWHYNEAAGLYATLVVACIVLEVIFKFVSLSGKEKTTFTNAKGVISETSKTILTDDNKSHAKNIVKKIIDMLKRNKKKLIGVIVVVFILMILLNIGKFVVNNFVGYTTFDVAENTIVVYNKNSFETMPEVSGNWSDNYYEPNGYYDDFKNSLKEVNGYSDEDIEKIPFASYDEDLRQKVNYLDITYDLSTDEVVKNGDTLSITASYDEDMAKEEKIEVVNTTFDVSISGLKEQVTKEDVQGEFTENEELTKEFQETTGYYDDEDYENQQTTLEGIYLLPSTEYTDSMQSIEYVYHITADYVYRSGKTSEREQYCQASVPIYKQNGELVVVEDSKIETCNQYWGLDDLVHDDYEKLN